MLREMKDEMEAMISDMAKGLDFELKLEPFDYLGVIRETDSSLSMALMMKMQIDVEGQRTEVVMAGGMNILMVRGKLLYLYLYSAYDSEADLEWVRAASVEWVDRIIKTNSEEKDHTDKSRP